MRVSELSLKIRSAGFVAVAIFVAGSLFLFHGCEPKTRATSRTAGRAVTATTLPSGGSWPAMPLSPVCASRSALDGPVSAPAGAVTVPAGDNSTVNFGLANTTYWLSAGIHTLGAV